MYQYSVSLAVFDYVPIALSAAGLAFIIATITHWSAQWRSIAALGAGLVISGGLLKASWKLLVASQQLDISWMNSALFFCLAPGMLILASSLWGASRGWPLTTQRPLIIIVSILIGVAFAVAARWPEQRYSMFYLLTLTTAGNLALVTQLIQHSLRHQQRLAALLFTCNFMAAFILVGLARIPDQSESLQWIEEIVNTLSQGAFAYAAFALHRALTAHQAEIR